MTDLRRSRSRTQNVVAMLPGADPELKDEVVILGAHYDHLGMGGAGSSSREPDTLAVHNGADDNASGVAALLELAEAAAAQSEPFSRSLLFIAFGAEEMGVLGSSYFVKNPLVELDQVSVMMNFDMIGRLDSSRGLTVYGTGTAANLESQLDRLIAGRRATHFNPEGLGPSDHAAFYAKDIPVLQFFTGTHDDYHTSRDDLGLLNIDGETDIVRMVYELVQQVAGNTPKLAFQQAGPQSRPSGRGRLRVTLGFMPDHAAADVDGLRIQAVTPGRPAQQAGLQNGDIITGMNGNPIHNIYEYMHRLSRCKPGQRVSVKVNRDGEERIFIVDL
ncbi:MAG: M20/M25/M40 family metallo-hydrolase [candidate division KSB1 bacterium]|nr:M20/M25/M40 family metallo-hydrolase [candidate division KSB1 bacterium]